MDPTPTHALDLRSRRPDCPNAPAVFNNLPAEHRLKKSDRVAFGLTTHTEKHMKHLLIILAFVICIPSMGCHTKKEKCMESARIQCLGESLQNKPVEYKGGLEVSCKQARFESCLNRVKNN